MTVSFADGYKVFEEAQADDRWFFYLATESYNGVFDNDKILYQWMTLEDMSPNSPDKPFSIGCKVTIGNEADFEIHSFEHDISDRELLHSNSTEIIGKIWSAQAADWQDEEEDTDWEAGKEFSSDAPVSEKYNTTNRGCYFSKKLPKIGRNPNDFNHTYKVTIGARVYDDAQATEFFDIPATISTIDQGIPKSFEKQVIAGSVANFASAIFAGVMMLFAISF